MHDHRALADWNLHLSEVVHAIGGTGFFPKLLAALAAQVHIDYPQVWFYRRGTTPRALYYNMDETHQTVQIDNYRNGGYQLDPFYLAFLKGEKSSGVRRLAEFTGELHNSDYFRTYYSDLHTNDEAVIMINIDNDRAVHLCLMRAEESAPFSAEEISLLRGGEELVRELVLLNARNTTFEAFNHSNHALETSLAHALKMFGSSILTGREKSVLDLLLRGTSTREAAEELGVAIDTLRKHRKNIYEKLHVSAQNELFALFLDSAQYITENPASDPLKLLLETQDLAAK